MHDGMFSVRTPHNGGCYPDVNKSKEVSTANLVRIKGISLI
uniref:Uncharacterized protein n=1 Tax=Rhizophora mucronata TaxID=61149 RepID=A0A2P2KV30_RHIMU